MANFISEPQKRSSNFPLTLHPTGQYCKKIKGKLYYFGADKQQAFQRYLEQATYLHSGKSNGTTLACDKIALKTLCNLYLEHQETRASVGEIKFRQLHDQIMLLRKFVKYFGQTRLVSEVSTLDLQNYRAKLIKEQKAATTINNHLSAIKAMFNWAIDNEIISSYPNLKAIKKIPRGKETKQTFSLEQIRSLLEHAGPQMKAMIWLGLNCGFGCTDCAELLWENVDVENARIHYPRGKTGIDRNLPLWPETVETLKVLSKINERVFNTRRGTPCVKTVQKFDKNGQTKYYMNDTIGREFSELIKKSGIKSEKGTGFYTLRRTAATLAARSGDPFAVQKLLGHADLKMASTYVQDVSEQTDRVINNTRKLIIQDNS